MSVHKEYRSYFLVAFTLALFFDFSCVDAQIYPKRELRAAWIATVSNIDWPSQKGLSSHEQQSEYVKLLDLLQSIGMNAVIVQVRPTADAFYPSSYEPWSEYLSGQQGKKPEPYYNPLSFMIHEAHQRGLEFHAWFNPYRASVKDSIYFSPDHPIHKHPDWFVKYGGKWYYDPGIPEAQEYVFQSIMETVKHYDLDAVHFDDYFYPYRIANEVFPDSCSYDAYGKLEYESVDDWRRNNVDFFVKELSTRIKLEKPHVKFGISPFGVWRNKDKDSEGSDTQAGQTNYDDLFADVLKWLKEGWIDYVTPQLYWNIGFKVADYSVLLDWWSRNCNGRHLYIGQGVYRIGGKGWENPEELNNQIALNRSYGEVNGSMYFSSKTFLNDHQGVNGKMKKIYPYPALIPPMSWIDDTPPASPAFLRISGSRKKEISLTWESASGDASYYVVYRFSKESSDSINNPAHIVGIVPRKTGPIQYWSRKITDKRKGYSYGITAVDRTHNESSITHAAAVKSRRKKSEIKPVSPSH